MMPATCVYMWGWVVSILENAQKGARWDTLSLNLLDGGEISASEGTGTFSGALVLGVTACNAVAYAILAWYLDQVIPGPFGRTRPWWFVFDPSYWLDKKSSALAVGVSGPHNSASLPDGVEPVNVDKNDAVPMIRVEVWLRPSGRTGRSTAFTSRLIVGRSPRSSDTTGPARPPPSACSPA